MEIDKKDLESLKHHIEKYFRMDDTDRPIDSLHNLEYILSKFNNTQSGEWKNTDEYQKWLQDYDAFLIANLNVITFFIEMFDREN